MNNFKHQNTLFGNLINMDELFTNKVKQISNSLCKIVDERFIKQTIIKIYDFKKKFKGINKK